MSKIHPEKITLKESSPISFEQDFSSYVKMINSSNKSIQFQGLSKIRGILSDTTNTPIRLVLESEAISKILEFLSWNHEPKFQLQSIWAISCLCNGTSEDVEFLVDLGVLDLVANLIESSSHEIAYYAVLTIAIIAGDSLENRDLCIGKNIIGKLCFAFNQFPSDDRLRSQVVKAINHFIKQQPLPAWDHISKALPLIADIIKESKDEDMLTDAMGSISYISDSYPQEVIDLGLSSHLVKHL